MENLSYIRTRYSESDALGHINNVSFFIYLEQARVDFLVNNGIVENTENWNFVVVSVHCDFIKQAYIHQKLVAKTSVSRIGRTSFTINHVIVDETTEEVIAKGEDVLVCFDLTEQSSKPLDDRMLEKLKVYVHA